MAEQIPERDWKYMRSIQQDLLSEVATSINHRSAEILSGDVPSELEKHRMLYQRILESDRVIAECFDDWRRSSIIRKILALHRHGLLRQEYIENLSEHTQCRVAAIEGSPV